MHMIQRAILSERANYSTSTIWSVCSKDVWCYQFITMLLILRFHDKLYRPRKKQHGCEQTVLSCAEYKQNN